MKNQAQTSPIDDSAAKKAAKALRVHRAIKKPKSSQHAAHLPTKSIAIWLLLLGALSLGVASYSLGLGLITGSVCALGLHLIIRHKNQRLWERAMNFKLLELTRRYETLENDVRGIQKVHLAAQESRSKKSAATEDKRNKNKKSKAQSYTGILRNLGIAQQKPKPASNDKAVPARYRAKAVRQSNKPYFSRSLMREKIYDAISHEQIAVFAQPIVSLPQRQTQFYEMFARLSVEPGVYVPAGQYLKLSNEENLTNDLDHLLLIETLRVIKKSANYKEDTLFFFNITTKTLKNKLFMDALLGFVRENKELASKLSFEIRQRDLASASADVTKILRGLAQLGCCLSLDHVTSFSFNSARMKELNIRFVKVDAMDLLHKSSPQRRAMMWQVKEQLKRIGIDFIVEKVETEAALLDLLDHNINYAQGYLFGRPDLLGSFSRRYAA